MQRRPLGANDNAPLPINWRRGLFRLWLLLSISWMMGWAVYLVMEAIQGGFQNVATTLDLPVLLLGPPVALFVFGTAAIWALRGFKPDDQL
jgi:hypothetical protein